jgi:DUF1365 family protein
VRTTRDRRGGELEKAKPGRHWRVSGPLTFLQLQLEQTHAYSLSLSSHVRYRTPWLTTHTHIKIFWIAVRLILVDHPYFAPEDTAGTGAAEPTR